MTEISKLPVTEAMRLCRDTTTIETIIELTKHSHPQVRQRALKEMCPCRVKKDHDDFWKRVLEMVDDEAVNVRQQVLHTLCDGSPAHLEFDVAEALDGFNRDSDSKIRRTAHKCLTTYNRTGKWNIL
ncbi:uncharacterized protein [Mytilus edulis]|uniref:HEAT repeat domain-containing protein n=1 Tax=Mytilus galloprovincialis TaxID=29158 RepID=A0A8B6H6V0_MYTGA|nr:Hypothetical predicted protein [Mytilus galloprovincialis]